MIFADYSDMVVVEPYVNPLEVFNDIICVIINYFVFLTPIYRHFWHLCYLSVSRESRSSSRSACFVLFLLPIHFYYLLGKLEVFNDIICIIINDFVILTPIYRHFWHFSYLLESLESHSSSRSTCFVLFLLPIHFFNILVKLDHVNGIICIIIDNCVFLYFAYFAYYLHILAVDSLYKYAHKFFFARIQKLHQTFFVSTDMLLMKTGEKMRGQKMDTEPPGL